MSAYASRIERLRALFDEAEIDGMLISQPESRYYLSGYSGHDLPPRDSAGCLMIGKQGAVLLTDPRTSSSNFFVSSRATTIGRSPSSVAMSANADRRRCGLVRRRSLVRRQCLIGW